jgi:hypothetical protein
MDIEENQKQVSLSAHSPWKSLPQFPHFHRRDDAGERGKPETSFPRSPAYDFPWDQIKKEAWRRSFAPPPGSLFD